ncbi:MAG: hypothetical protein JWP26_40 [Devosia sp.]|uniref:hypothetical protein n=1 Tax=Devosia sp. TaxID=1871048 RepID=UPI002615A9FA|nr:hypothetical protein [Devosia sp.]MDB5585070.1 hypothetical protein [Devosia sp.]
MATQLCRVPAEAASVVNDSLASGGSAFVCSSQSQVSPSFSLIDYATPTLALFALLTAFSYYYATLQYGRDRDISTKRKFVQDEFRQVVAPLNVVASSFDELGESVLALLGPEVQIGSVLETIRFRTLGAAHSFHARLKRVKTWAQEWAPEWSDQVPTFAEEFSKSYDNMLILVANGMGRPVDVVSEANSEGISLAAVTSSVDVMGPSNGPEAPGDLTSTNVTLCAELRAHCLKISRAIEDAVFSLEATVNGYDFSKAVPSVSGRIPVFGYLRAWRARRRVAAALRKVAGQRSV